MKFFLIIFFFSISSFAQTNHIKSVMLYKYGSQTDKNFLGDRSLFLNENSSLILEFDDLDQSYSNYTVKLKHLNINNSVSRINESTYLGRINDFPITEYSVSMNTKTSYYHYYFVVPKVKISGKYLLEVWSGNEIVIEEYFYVVAGEVQVGGNVEPADGNEFYRTHQKVELRISYANANTYNPMSEFTVLVQQNNDPSTIKMFKRPSYNNAALKELRYSYFAEENLFEGRNEFREFDIRSSFSTGRFVERIENNDNIDEVYIKAGESRKNGLYFSTNDLNGNYFIESLENDSPGINADYVWVNFKLLSPFLGESKGVYINGAFCNYKINDNNLLSYDTEEGAYTGRYMLKQGFYDYTYVLKDHITNSLNSSYFEGNHSETNNTYQVFVYQKPMGSRYTKLVGYRVLNAN